MSSWRTYCCGGDLTVNGDEIKVHFRDGRAQKVTVTETDDFYRLFSMVAKRRLIEDEEQVALEAWVRNRVTRLVGFRIDARGNLLGESWVPRVGLTDDEFSFYVRNIAAECDRFEYLLTGKDIE